MKKDRRRYFFRSPLLPPEARATNNSADRMRYSNRCISLSKPGGPAFIRLPGIDEPIKIRIAYTKTAIQRYFFFDTLFYSKLKKGYFDISLSFYEIFTRIFADLRVRIKAGLKYPPEIFDLKSFEKRRRPTSNKGRLITPPSPPLISSHHPSHPCHSLYPIIAITSINPINPRRYRQTLHLYDCQLLPPNRTILHPRRPCHSLHLIIAATLIVSIPLAFITVDPYPPATQRDKFRSSIVELHLVLAEVLRVEIVQDLRPLLLRLFAVKVFRLRQVDLP